MRRLSNQVAVLLVEVLQGDRLAETLTRAERKRLGRRSRWSLFHADEDGKISFVTIFTVLAFFVMIGLVTNSGVVVNEKLQAQNAADAAAYSTSLWMARGMNAITATNHLMGELTALMVVIESLGGPELENSSSSRDTEEIRKMNAKIRNPLDGVANLPGEYTAFLGGSVFTATGSVAESTRLAEADRKFVQFVKKLMVEGKASEITAGATIYDAQLTLKYWVAYGFKVKLLINVAYAAVSVLTFGAFEPTASGVACVAHGVIDIGVAWVCKDWVLMKGVELLAIGLQPVKKAIPFAISALSVYGDSIAKRGRLAKPIATTLDELGRDLNTELAVFPAPDDIHLPIVPEQPPSEDGVPQKRVPPSLWDGNLWDKYWLVSTIKWPERQLAKPIDEANKWLDKFTVRAPDWRGRWRVVFKFPDIPTIDELTALLGFPDGPQKLDGVEKLKNMQPGGFGYPDNYSLQKLPRLNWEEERYSQWVRATYPYVESWRSAFNEFFYKHIGMSNAWTYYTNWTNRYTIAVSYHLRKPIISTDEKDRQKQSLLDELKAKVTVLRAKFDDIIEGLADEEGFALSTEKGPFEEISEDLDTFVRDWKNRASQMGILAEPLHQWIDDVLSHGIVVGDVADAAGFDGGFDVSETEFRELERSLVRIEALDNLLRLLDELLHLLDLPLPHMYVLQGMTPDIKGREPWTTNRESAESLFTLVAAARRPSHAPPFGPTFFVNPRSEGINTFAQSLLYNANSRDVTLNSSGLHQPNTGWDTLNWQPPVRASEWSGAEPGFGGSSPRQLFQGRFSAESVSRVQVNWQAKLVPLGSIRLPAAISAGLNQSAMPDSSRVIDYFDGLISH